MHSLRPGIELIKMDKISTVSCSLIAARTWDGTFLGKNSLLLRKQTI